ncbi:MAG: hypothetical protein UU23_C0001G0057 [Candidatus Curtissbacteria bacterium GW2011_GWA1_40_9]|uniref:Polymerase beta nucleotidyltransferase domain-containing protein n=1 Tax=Candidatus Curtissbacteria bacterium GW2011_GWA1_40_9 TaxID=1618408 RepID=A0A0G0TMS2_9BACT|nr:MAG: hypothetical protein UU23_C0001G0057 [Candidatus Curtissbacteria bacterium GW2011_GWA1_40_9]
MANNKLYDQIKTIFKKEPEILTAYVIGSTVTKKTTAESDFDLVVVVRNKRIMDSNKVYELVKHLNFPKDLDLSTVDKTSSPIFLFQIITKGELIYEKSRRDKNNFEAFTIHNYYDTAYIRNTYNKFLKDKLAPYAN